MSVSTNKLWVDAILEGCKSFVAQLQNSGEPIDDIVSLAEIVGYHSDKVFTSRKIALLYPKVLHGQGFWEFSASGKISQAAIDAAHIVVELQHDAYGNVTRFNVTKLRYGFNDVFNLYLKVFTSQIEYANFDVTDIIHADYGTKTKANPEKVQDQIAEDTYLPKADCEPTYAGNADTSDVKVTGEHGGVKLDGAKAKFGLVPPDAYLAVAEVMTAGALKYSANNWVGLELSRVLDAMERHINAFRMGEEFAADSKQHHMAHAIANAMMAYHIVRNKPEQDDRLFKYLTPQTNAYDMYVELLESVANHTTKAVPESDIKKFYQDEA